MARAPLALCTAGEGRSAIWVRHGRSTDQPIRLGRLGCRQRALPPPAPDRRCRHVRCRYDTQEQREVAIKVIDLEDM